MLTEADRLRLGDQKRAVYDVLKDGRWHSMPEIMERIPGIGTGVSGRINELRKQFNIACRRSTGGTYEYQLTARESDGQLRMF